MTSHLKTDKTRRHATRVAARWICAIPFLYAVPHPASAQLMASDVLTGTGAGTSRSDQPVGVQQRQRPGYEPAGVRLGPFLVTPMLTTSVGYDDNALMLPTKGSGDVVTRIAPLVRLRSYTGRVDTAAELGVEQVLFSRHTELNGINARAIGQGRVQIDTRSQAWVSGAYIRQVDGGVTPVLETPDLMVPAVLSYDPVTTNLFRVAGGYGVTLNRITTNFAIGAQRRSYEQSNEARSTYDATQRDGDALALAARAGYRVADGQVAFVQLSYNTRSYRNALFDSSGYRVDVGFTSDLLGLLQGEISGGYIQQELASGQGRISAPSYGASLRWFPSERATLTANLRREVGEPSVVGQAPLLSTIATLQAEFELRHDVILTGRYIFSRTTYETGEPRYVNYAEVGPTWFLNRNLRLSATYRYANGTSSDSTGNYSRNIAMLRLRLAF